MDEGGRGRAGGKLNGRNRLKAFLQNDLRCTLCHVCMRFRDIFPLPEKKGKIRCGKWCSWRIVRSTQINTGSVSNIPFLSEIFGGPSDGLGWLTGSYSLSLALSVDASYFTVYLP